MTIGEGREILKGMRVMNESAPPGLEDDVLAAVGLIDSWTEFEGPIGPLYVAWGEDGITAAEPASDAMGFELEYETRVGRSLRRVPEMPPAMAKRVTRLLNGEKTTKPDVDLAVLTEFEEAVLRKTLEIPYGETRPYSWVAREIGRPRAVRAVGTALAHNPVTFVIPCHRVVRADGRIGEYGAGGPEAKRKVLGVEGVDADEMESLAASGVRFTGSDTTNIYCYPSCRHARRTMAVHTVRFRSASDALDAGYRPCRHCRPQETAVFAA